MISTPYPDRMDQQVVTGAFTLGAVTLTWAGARLNERFTSQRTGKTHRKDAVVELMTTYADVLHAARALHSLKPDRTRSILRTLTEALAVSEEPPYRQVVAAARIVWEIHDGRRATMDFREILSPELTRFHRAVVAVALLGDEQLRAASAALAEAAYEVLGGIASSSRKFERLELRSGDALRDLRLAYEAKPKRWRRLPFWRKRQAAVSAGQA